jgi:hypothetical protein
MKWNWTEREFWIPVVTAIIGILTQVGVIGPDDETLMQYVTSLALIVLPATSYIIFRIWQKITETKTDAAVKIAKAEASVKIAEAEAQVKVVAAGVQEP